MLSRLQEPKPIIFLLADHLDALLAAGEDLLAVRSSLASALTCAEASTIEGRLVAQRLFVERVHSLELSVVLRTLEARKAAQRLPRGDSYLRMMASLFVGGTAALADAVEEIGDRTSFDFQTGHETVAYLRSRGVVAPDAAGPIDLDQLAVTPQFLIARQIELGPLMDLAATFLDALDLVHDIYGADHDGLAYASADLVPGEHPTHS